MIATTFLAAPLYLLLPLGVGLLFTQPVAPVLTRTQRLLLAYLVGLVAVAALFVSRDHGWGFDSAPAAAAGFVLAVSIVGFVIGRRLFSWDAAARVAAADFAWALPFFAIGYALRFFVFSEFPVTDLYQFTHPMKGAVEFGRFDTLNPFTSDSYAPVLPVIEGLLFRYLGYEPLFGMWIVSALSIGPKFLALRAVVQATLATRDQRLFALAAAACFVSPVASTNGDLAMLGALLLFSVIAAQGARRPTLSALTVLAMLAAYAVAHVAVRQLPPLGYLAVLALACTFPWLKRTTRSAGVLAMLPAVVALAPMHRSAMVLVPASLVCGALLAYLRARAKYLVRLGNALPVLAVTGTAIVGLGVAGLLIFVLTNPAESLRENALNRWLVETLLNKGLQGNLDILFGSGPKIALFELARAMSPSFVLACGACVWLAWRATGRSSQGVPAAARAIAAYAMAGWTLALALGAFLLLGLPFAYRSGFLIVVVLAIALSSAFSAARAAGRDAWIERTLLGLAAAYALAMALLAYGCAHAGWCRRAEYLDMALPFWAVLGFAGAAAALIALWLCERRRLPLLLTPATLSFLFAFEFTIGKAYFMPYHYGPADRSAVAVSHISPEEVRLATTLRGLGHDVALVSDPFTMMNLTALTGLNGLITVSNLDTLAPHAMARLRSWLRAVLEASNIEGPCAPEPPLVLARYGPSPEFNYWLLRNAQPLLSGRETLEMLGYRNTFQLTAGPALRAGSDPRLQSNEWVDDAAVAFGSAVSDEQTPIIALVISRKTVAWAQGDEGKTPYFSDVRPLDTQLLERLKRRCDVRIYDGRFALVRFALGKS